MKNISTLDDHFIKLITLKSKNPRAYQIYNFIVSHIGNTRYLMCSENVFKDKLNIPLPIVDIAIRELQKIELIRVIKSNTEEYKELKESNNIVLIGDRVLESSIYKKWI